MIALLFLITTFNRLVSEKDRTQLKINYQTETTECKNQEMIIISTEKDLYYICPNKNHLRINNKCICKDL